MCVLDNRMLRIGTYFLAPHNYVALCLASRFRRAKVLFYLLAGFQVAADFASCVALAMVMSAHGDALASAGSQHRTAIIQFADDGQMTGGFSVDFIDDSDPPPPTRAEDADLPKDGEWVLSGDQLELNWYAWDSFFTTHENSIALAIGYSVTAAGFVMFFGPATVASLMSGAWNGNRHTGLRIVEGVIGVGVALSLLYIIAVFIMMACGVDIWCDGFVGRYPCDHGTCLRGQCIRPCTDGFSGPSCECTPAQCGGHGACSGEDNICVCEPEYRGSNCTIEIPQYFTGSELIKPQWGETLNEWAGHDGRFWELCYSTFTDPDAVAGNDRFSSDSFHRTCDMYDITFSVARNTNYNQTYGGYAVGSWDVNTCCSNSENICSSIRRSGGADSYACTCARHPFECLDRSADSDFLFSLSPGKPSQYLPKPVSERPDSWYYQTAVSVPLENRDPEEVQAAWPSWDGLSMNAGTGQASCTPSLSAFDYDHSICEMCYPADGPSNTKGCAFQGYTHLEVWRLRSL